MERVSVILGFFDGVHAGHRNVIKTAVDYPDTKTVLLTFKDSPAGYFGKKIEYIYPREKSYRILKNLGVDEIIETDFSKVANISAEDYLETYIIKRFSPITISTGFNHTFGQGRKGNPDFLNQNQKKYGYKYFCTQACRIDGEIVSSTFIRGLLSKGELKKANELLKGKFSVTSKVIKGRSLGQKLGFPTANMVYPEKIVKLPNGVYKSRVSGMPAIVNWGIKPTVSGKEELLEVHIPNFSGDLYGQTLEVEFIEKIRDEKKFDNIEELKAQIAKDVEKCLKS